MLFGVGGQEGAQDGGHGAPVLVEAGRHFRRQKHRAAAQHRVGILPAHDLGHLLLMGRVHERPGQTHCDGPHTLAHQMIDRGQHVLGPQRHQHLAEAVDTLAHPHPQRLGHQVVGPLRSGAVDLHLQRHPVRPRARPGDVHRVLLARGGDEAHLGSGPLDEGIGAHRGGVLHSVGGRERLLRFPAEPPDRLGDGLEHPVGQVGMGGERLAGGLASAQHHERVGERAPDVHVEKAQPPGVRRWHRGPVLCRG